MSAVTHVPAEECDAERIFALEKELVDRYEDVENIEYDKVIAWIKKSVTEDLPYSRRILSDGEHVGFFTLKDRLFGSFFVFPEHRGKGVGSYVLDRFITEQGLPVTLYVFKKNAGALSLYLRHGFKVKEEAGKTRYILEKNS